VREDLGLAARRRERVLEVADLLERPPLAEDLLGEGHAGRREVTSTIASIRPWLRAASAPIGSPLTIIWSAFSTPTTRGSRCVPPAPGRRPSLTSGRPKRAVLTPTR